MTYSGSGDLPHQYVWIQPGAIGDHDWLRAVWFGLSAYPGRAWAAHVLLACGAIYRSVPLHSLASQRTDTDWTPAQAATWDAYGYDFSVIEYVYLRGAETLSRTQDGATHRGQYLCSIVPIGDGWSAWPEQSKELVLSALDSGRYTLQPTNHVLVRDASWTDELEWPAFLRRQTEWHSAET